MPGGMMYVELVTGKKVLLGTVLNALPRLATLGRAYTGTLKRLHEAAAAFPEPGEFLDADHEIFRRIEASFFAGTTGCLIEEVADIVKAAIVSFRPCGPTLYFVDLQLPVRPSGWGYEQVVEAWRRVMPAAA